MNTAAIIAWFFAHLNYWTITLLMAVESSFIPFPSEVVVPPAAWYSMTNDGLNIFLIIVVATLGADVGALINYFLAKWLGRPLVYKFADTRLSHMLLIDREGVEKAEKYFRDHGIASTFFGRLIPGIRQLISLPAGLAGMPLKPFLLYTTLGAALWNSVLALIGYVIYRMYPDADLNKVKDLATEYNHELSMIILGLVVLIVAYLIYKGVKK